MASPDVKMIVDDFIEKLKQRNEDARFKVLQQLSRFMNHELSEMSSEQVTAFMEMLNVEIAKMIKSSDSYTKKGAVLTLGILLDVDIGNLPKNISRSQGQLGELQAKETEPALLQLIAALMGKIALRAGQAGGDIVEFQTNKAIEDLTSERTERNDSRRLSAVYVLRELAVWTPTLFYQTIRRFFGSIFCAIRDPKPLIRLNAAAALRAALAIVAKREIDKEDSYALCYDNCTEYNQDLVNQEKVKPTRDDWSHGTLLIIEELLRCSNIEGERLREELAEMVGNHTAVMEAPPSKITSRILSSLSSQFSGGETDRHTVYTETQTAPKEPPFESDKCKNLIQKEFDKICSMVLVHRSNRSPLLQQALVNIIPRLAAFNPSKFQDRFLKVSVNFFISALKRERDKYSLYLALGLLCVAVGKEIRPYLTEIFDVVSTALPRDLQQKKQKFVTVEPSVFICISLLARWNSPEIIMKVRDLLGPMLHAPLSPALTASLKDIAQRLPSLRREIQDGLLQVLSLALTGKSLSQPGSVQRLAIQSASVYDAQGVSSDLSSMTLALRTLATFDFKDHSLTKLLRHCADNFLSSDHHEVRLEAVKACCSLLSQCSLSTNGQSSQSHTVADVLTKLLVVGITDTDADIRFCVLQSLDSRFDHYLAQAENLASLFMALNDEQFTIRCRAMLMIGRLSVKNPAYVMPSLRKVLIQLMAVLKHSSIGRDKEQAATMLGLLVYHTPRIINPYLECIVDCLMAKLNALEQNTAVLTTVLESLGAISEVAGTKMLKYTDSLLPTIIAMLEDSSSTHKREVAIRTLGQVVASTGLVVEPYIRFPNLLPILLKLLRTVPEHSVRKELIRLLGLLGALDPYRYKLNVGKIGGKGDAGAVVLSMWEPSGDRYDSADITTNEMLVSMSSATLDEFYPAAAIACMMRIINEPSLAQFHPEAVSAINTIFKSLGVRSVQYIQQVVPACLNVMRTNHSVREFLFKQLGNVVSIVKLHVKPYLEDIFAIIHLAWNQCFDAATEPNNVQRTIIDFLKLTVAAIGTEFKIYLPGIIPHMLKVFIHDKSPERNIIHILMEAIQEFGINLDGYIHLLLPPIMLLLDQPDVPNNVKRVALETVERLTDCLDLADYAARVIHPIVRLLDIPTPDLTEQAIATLCALANQLGKKYWLFIPMVQKVLTRQRISDNKYTMLVKDIVDGTIYSLAGGSAVKKMPEPDLASVQIKREKLQNNPQSILNTCRGTTRVSKEDWMEWLRRFNTELLKESPSPALRACISCAKMYQRVAKELFNAAFVSCWSELTPSHQTEMIEGIETALDHPSIQEITQTLLNLAEFMEHCDKGTLPVRPKLLGEQAMACRAYAKALHYIEEEFQECTKEKKEGPTMELLEKLISVNNKLQQKEASRGVLLYAQKHFGGHNNREQMAISAKIPGHFYEKLHQWEEARRVYEDELKDEKSYLPADARAEARTNSMLGKMRCLEALGEWNEIDAILTGDGICSWQRAEDEKKVTPVLARMAAASAWGRDETDPSRNKVSDMVKYTEHLPRESFDGLFYRAVLYIMRSDTDPMNMFSRAQDCIEKARDLISTELTALASESYSRAYGAMVNVQILAELEEVIRYKLIPDQREAIRGIWWKRMNGCQKIVDDWAKLLRVHSLVLNPLEDTKACIKFASLCRQNDRMAMSENILKKLIDMSRKSCNTLPGDVQLRLQIADLKHCWEARKDRESSHPLTEARKDLIDRAYGSFLDNKDDSRQKTLRNLKEFVRAHGTILAHTTNPSGRSLLSKCYLKLGSWTEIIYGGYTIERIPEILSHYKEAVKLDTKWYKAWHAYAYTNYEAVLLYKSIGQENGSGTDSPKPHLQRSLSQGDVLKFCQDAIEGFFKSIALSDGNSLQDTLRLLTLWFDYGEEAKVHECLVKGLRAVKIENWLQVIPQLIARIDTNRPKVGKLIHTLLCDIGKHHPQALIYPLTVAAKSSATQRRDAAKRVLDSMSEHSPTLVNQALMVSEELIRVAILWHELWHEGLEEASRLYFGDRDVKGMFGTLEPLHQMLERGPQTLKEASFHQTYGPDLSEAQEWCKKFQRNQNSKELTKAWDSYYQVFRRISKQLTMLTSLELQYVSPKLLDARELELAVPGTYEPAKEIVKISHVHSSLQVITSKQRPRKLSIYGANGKEYQFLLKGHEDLRQDERVMQLFGLVNSLLLANTYTCRRNLTIQRYSVIPLSTNSGLIGWVPHCDTLHSLIRDYRERKKILLNIEHRIMMRMAPDYDHLTLIQKVEVFEHALENTKGDDLAKILWFKSPTSEVWFDRRTNYTRSLAVMSMVGYVLGLGDRHPSNLMLNRESGKIIHIDFGDCFEVAMSREKFPEKIPFRLTRMLINAMEVTGIDGNYRMTCERVMQVLRENKDSVMAVLEAFVYDPLLNWWLLEGKAAKTSKVQQSGEPGEELEIERRSRKSNASVVPTEDSEAVLQGETVNRKALAIVRRVKDKLTGMDFPSPTEDGKFVGAGVAKQVVLLIEHATSHPNLCQCYIGWCPFW